MIDNDLDAGDDGRSKSGSIVKRFFRDLPEFAICLQLRIIPGILLISSGPLALPPVDNHSWRQEDILPRTSKKLFRMMNRKRMIRRPDRDYNLRGVALPW